MIKVRQGQKRLKAKCNRIWVTLSMRLKSNRIRSEAFWMRSIILSER